jgi:pilus assembly protein Flp/PilA
MLQIIENLLAQLTTDEEGATMAEYGLLLAFIAVVALVGVTLLGNNLLTLFNNVAGSL